MQNYSLTILRYRGVEPQVSLQARVKFESATYQRLLEEFIIYGGYPGVVVLQDQADKESQLQEIYSSYIQKDIGDFWKVDDLRSRKLSGLPAIMQRTTCRPCKTLMLSGCCAVLPQPWQIIGQDTEIVFCGHRHSQRSLSAI